jgi:hypothetical protein
VDRSINPRRRPDRDPGHSERECSEDRSRRGSPFGQPTELAAEWQKDRPDIWFVLEDGSNLGDVTEDALQTLLTQGIPFIELMADPADAAAYLGTEQNRDHEFEQLATVALEHLVLRTESAQSNDCLHWTLSVLGLRRSRLWACPGLSTLTRDVRPALRDPNESRLIMSECQPSKTFSNGGSETTVRLRPMFPQARQRRRNTSS